MSGEKKSCILEWAAVAARFANTDADDVAREARALTWKLPSRSQKKSTPRKRQQKASKLARRRNRK